MKPVIGITCKFLAEKKLHNINEEYIRAIEATGGIPLLVPLLESIEVIEALSKRINGLLLAGGWDVAPALYGEKPDGVKETDPFKDFLEINLAKFAIKLKLPILGICRGCQMLNVVNGGTLIQDIQNHYQTEPTNQPTHEIKIKKDSLLFKLVGKETLMVNTFHHQSVKAIAPGFKVSALSGDGIIEGIEHTGDSFMMGIQFHAEYLWPKQEEIKRIFSEFVKKCKDYKIES